MAIDVSESSWKSFIKKHKLEGQLEDKDLLKALARFDKTDERKPEPRLEALAELIKEVPKQVTALVKLKKKLGDKPFGLVKDELYGILEEAEKLQKKTQAAVDAEAAKEAKEAKDPKAGKDDEGDGEDEPGSVLLDPKRLVAQLKMCQRTPDRTVQFAYLDPASKDKPAVLAMHPKMSSTSIFNKLKKETGGKTGAYGSAWVDGTSLMLQLDKPLGGLVKKVRAAVKAAGFRVAKVVLWQADGTVFEQDDAPDDAVGDGAAVPVAPAAAAAPSPQAPPPPSETYAAKLAALQPRVKQAIDGGSHDAVKLDKLMQFSAAKAQANDFLGAIAALKQVGQLLDQPTPHPDRVVPDAGAAFKARLTALIPRLKDAQATGHPAAQDVKLKVSEAGVLAGKRDFAGGQQLLDEVEELLLVTSPREPAPAQPTEAKASVPAGTVGVRVMRFELRNLRTQAAGGMAQLHARLDVDEHPQAEAIAGIVKKLSQDMPGAMEGVLLDMEKAMEDQDTGALAACRAAVRKGATEWLAFLQANQDAIQGCENNPWGIPIKIDQPLRASLKAILKTAQ